MSEPSEGPVAELTEVHGVAEPGPPPVLDERESRQQKDNLCGPFHAARVLRDAGFTEWRGMPLVQDLVAARAQTGLPSREIGPQVPPGAISWREYRYELGRVEPADSGTQPGPLSEAIEELSGGALASVPLSGEWTASVVTELLQRSPDGARLIANVRTAGFWGSRPPLAALLGVLDGSEVEDPPAPDWDVGHFVELVQLVRGRVGALVLVRDTYPSLGWGGHHLQPPGALAAALTRGDGRGGGIMAVVADGQAGRVRALAGEIGLAIKLWEN
jgi:hypothetical protein